MSAPSPFLLRWCDALRAAARSGPVLDLACGRGRHAREVAHRGMPVIALDRDAERLAALHAHARAASLPIALLRADLETGHGIPLASGRCGAVLVFRYLHRPLAPEITRVLRPGGLLLYETFTSAQRALGSGPRNPDFLLEPGELPRLFADLVPLAHEETCEGDPPAALARLAARRA